MEQGKTQMCHALVYVLSDLSGRLDWITMQDWAISHPCHVGRIHQASVYGCDMITQTKDPFTSIQTDFQHPQSIGKALQMGWCVAVS